MKHDNLGEQHDVINDTSEDQNVGKYFMVTYEKYLPRLEPKLKSDIEA